MRWQSNTVDGGDTFFKSWLPLILLMVAAIGILASYWSPAPFWIDAEGYARAVEKGDVVVHPPGYIGFIQLGKWIKNSGLGAYTSLQLISAISYLASIPLVYLACRLRAGRAMAVLFASMYVGSWVCLNIATVGTTHASDLLFGAAVAWLVCLPGRGADRWWWYPLLAATFVTAAAFRMSTVVMYAPLALVLLIMDFRNRWLWISAAIGGLLMAVILWKTAAAYGGLEQYQALTAELNETNRRSGLLSGGGWRSGGVNFVRAGFWFWMAAPALPWLIARGWRKAEWWKSETDWLLVAAMSGGLVVNFGYLCVHPGYFAPILAVFSAFAAGIATPERQTRVIGSFLTAVAMALFLLGRPLVSEGSVPKAVSNALVWQYSAVTQRNAVPIRTMSEWLMLSGLDSLAPAYRRENIEDLRKSSAAKDEIDPGDDEDGSGDAAMGE